MTAQQRQRRNIGIVAHINAGKTTITERILFDSGKQRFMGEVDEGTATMDFLAEEQDRGISISAAVTTVAWRQCELNLVDMPGHVDFTAEVERCLRVLDGAIVLVDGVRGVESQTEMVWRHAVGRGLARLVFVNKMDRPGADFDAAVAAVSERLSCRAVPVAVPLRADGELVGIFDLVTGTAVARPGVAASPAAEFETARAHLLEAAADFDESILVDYVEGRQITAPRLRAALRRGVLAGQIVPVLGGAALHNQGVEELLDAVCDYLPAPEDLAPVVSIDVGGGSRRPLASEPFCGFVFKTHRDEEGVLHFVRVYSGILEPGQAVCSTGVAGAFTVDALWRMHADHRQPLDRASAGDIVAIEAGARLGTGETLFAPQAPMRLEPVSFSEPVLMMTIEAPSESEAAAVEVATRRLAEDDPTLRIERDAETGALLVAGMGELHLEVFGSRLRRRVGSVRFGRPLVAFRQTVLRPGRASAECRAARADGGLRSARVELEVVPEAGVGPARVDDAGRGPPQLRAALVAALADRARTGLTEPFPAAGLRLRLLDLGGDEAAPEDVAALLFFEALDVACRKAVTAAAPVLLEPCVSIEVFAPTDTLSGVLADLNARRVRIEAIDAAGPALSRVRGQVPLQEMLGYLTRLRSLTRGLGSVQMVPAGYARQAEPRAARGAAQKGHADLDPDQGDQ